MDNFSVDPEQIIEKLKRIIENMKVEKKAAIHNEKNLPDSPQN